MGKETKKKEIVLTRENSLILPRILTEVGMTPSVINNRLSVAFVKRLQDAFKQIISDNRVNKGWQLGLFDTPDVREKYLNDGCIEFRLHMNELVDSKTNYQTAFDFVAKAELIKVIAPHYDNGVLKGFRATALYEPEYLPTTEVVCEVKDKKTGELSEVTVPLEDFIKKRISEGYEFTSSKPLQYRYMKNTPPVIIIRISRVVAEHIYNMRANKYGNILDKLSVSSNNKYFSPIYNWIAVRQKEGIVEVDYEEWKQNILGHIPDEDGNMPILKGYDKFSQFNKAVLAPCLKELRDKGEEGTDCWAEVEKIYLNGRAPNPDRLRFHIYVTALGKRLQEEKEATKQMMEIEKRLREEFDQNDIQVYSISKNIPIDHRSQLVAKMNELSAKKKAGKIKIEQSWQQYCNVVFSHLIADIRKEESQDEQVIPVVEEIEPVVDIPVQEVELSEEVQNMWKRFMDELRERVGDMMFNDYMVFLGLKKYEGGVLTISAPSKFIVEVIERECLQQMKESLELAFPTDTRVVYVLG